MNLLREGGFGVGIAGSAEHCDEDLRLMNFAGHRIGDRHGGAGIIDKHLLAGEMSLPHREFESRAPLLVVETELRGLVVIVGIGLGVLFPKQLTCDALTLEFLMNGGEIRLSEGRLWSSSRRKELTPELGFAQVIREWPSDVGGVGGLEIFVDNAGRDFERSGDLMLR